MDLQIFRKFIAFVVFCTVTLYPTLSLGGGTYIEDGGKVLDDVLRQDNLDLLSPEDTLFEEDFLDLDESDSDADFESTDSLESDKTDTEDYTQEDNTEALLQSRVLVKGYRFIHSDFMVSQQAKERLMVSQDDLQALLADTIGKEWSIKELESHVNRVNAYYREKGITLPHAYLPPQNISDNIITVVINEMQRGDMIMKNPGNRIRNGRIEQIFRASGAAYGTVLEEAKLERALLLLNDWPGINAQGTLAPAPAINQATLNVDIEETSKFGEVDLKLNNSGFRYNGSTQFNIGARALSPFGYGEVLEGQVIGSHTLDLQIYRMAASIPVGSAIRHGLRVGASGVILRSELCCEFEPLDISNKLEEGSLDIFYPLVRRARKNLNMRVQFSIQQTKTRSRDTKITDRKTYFNTISLFGNIRDNWGNGGYTPISLSTTNGTVSIPDRTLRANDRNEADITGYFGLVNGSIARLQVLDKKKKLWLLVALEGQYGFGNLPNSARPSLGGVTRVRGYPTGEGLANDMARVAVEIRYYLYRSFRMGPFYDHACARSYQKKWPTRPLNNTFCLQSVGFSAVWNAPHDFIVEATWGHAIGNFKGRDGVTRYADGRNNDHRVWLQLSKTFSI